MELNNRKMLIALQYGQGNGAERGAWRFPGSNSEAYMDYDYAVKLAKMAEQAKIQMIFLPDHPAVREDLTFEPPFAEMEPLILITAMARETKKIGLVLTQSTTLNFPYTVARQMKTLDVISHGRAGWNAVTTNDPRTAANYGVNVANRTERYESAHEFIQLVQALWGSWGKDALKLDVENGIWADAKQIQPINLGGKYLTSRGPLPIPPSEQGQPIIFQAGGGKEGLELAGRYASGVYSAASDLRMGHNHRELARQSAFLYGRNPDDIKLFMGIFTSIADTEKEGLERRKMLLELIPEKIPHKLAYLSAMVGVSISMEELHLQLSEDKLQYAQPNPNYPNATKALYLFQQGLTAYEVLSRGVTDFHMTLIGTPEQVADQMENLFISGACDGFSVLPDVVHDGVPDFLNKVVPILQERKLFHDDYEGTTLREHMGVSL